MEDLKTGRGEPVEILVIGGSGFIGACLVNQLSAAGYRAAYTYAHRPRSAKRPARAYRVQLEDEHALATCLSETCPRVVVHCAVPPILTAGEAQHSAVSVAGVQRIFDTLEKINPRALFIYFSTNAIFSGQSGPYRESDPPDPDRRADPYRPYARARAAGEQLTLAQWPNALVIRTAHVNGRDGQGQLNPRLARLVEHLRAGQSVTLFCDRWISPTLVDNLAEALLETLAPSFTYRGILHLAGRQSITDYEYARQAARQLRMDENLVTSDSIANAPTLANVSNTSLDVLFTQSLLRTRLLNVPEQLARLFP